MTPSRWGRVCELFELALRHQPDERPTALASACVGDTALHAEVAELLTCDERAGRAGFLGEAAPPDRPGASMSGRRVGPYLIRERLAVGGMGCVYRATRVDDYRQEVALKLVKPGEESDELLLRFRNERQLLAGLGHPHIARLLDGGVTDEGAPYFVMEYIPGSPLDRYCDAHRLDTAGRVRLFRLVCLAVDYAHRQSVVHRDLKPDNVLVTPDGTPKVTDFGLAKSTDRRTGGDRSLTETGGVLGSPSYMAPEQAGGSGEVGLAADVYALGAILYELLTGRPPFRAETPVQTVFQVLHEDPLPPRRLDPRVSRDLETICLKCLAKEPARRYASAAALADDIGRFLAGEPILARPVSRAERLWRQCRRRPLVAGLLAALALALTTGFVAALTLWLEAERRGAALRKEKEAADRQRDQARRAVDDMYTRVAEQWLAAEPHMQVVQREFLQKALDYYQELTRESGDDPEVRHRTAQAYYRIGKLHAKLGDGPSAEEAQRRAIGLWQPLAREYPDDPRFPLALFHAHLSLAPALAMVGRRDEIPAAERQSLTHAEDLVRRFPDDPLHHDLLAYHYKTMGMRELIGERYREAEELSRRGLAVAEGLTRQYPQRSMFGRNVARNLHILAVAYRATGRPAESLDALRAALRAATAVDAANDPTVLPFDRAMFRLELALYHFYLGDGLMTAGRPDEAEPHLAQSVAISEKMAGDYPALCSCRLQFASVLAGLGQCHHLAGRAGPAEEAYARHLRLLEQLIADFPGLAADVKWRLVWALCTCPVERFRDGARAIALIGELHGPSPAPRERQFALGLARYRARDWRGCVTDLEKGLTGDPSERITSAFYLAMAHRELGDSERAREYYRRAVDGLRALTTPDLLALRGETERVLGAEFTSPR